MMYLVNLVGEQEGGGRGEYDDALLSMTTIMMMLMMNMIKIQFSRRGGGDQRLARDCPDLNCERVCLILTKGDTKNFATFFQL